MAKPSFLEDPVDDVVTEPEVIPEPVETPPEQPAAEVIPEPDAKPEPGHIPITALMDERDRRKAAEARLAAFEKPAPAPIEIPDMFEDPDGHTAALQAAFDSKLYEQTLNISRRFAVQQFGEAATETAVEWARAKCDMDPYFNIQVRQSGDPVGYAVQQYQREQIASKVSLGDFEQFTAWKAAQTAIAPQPNAQPIPTASINAIPSAGGVTHEPEVGPEEAYKGLFKR